MNKTLLSGSRFSSRRSPVRRCSRRLRFEPLEIRLLLAINIDWHNRGVTSANPFPIPVYDGVDLEPDDADTPDNFNFAFGAQAAAARNVVDAALAAWENVIDTFNDGSNSGDDFLVTISVDMTKTNCGGGARTPGGGDPLNGKPDEGTIILNACSNWFVDPTPTESSEFLGPIFNAFAGKAQAGSPAAGMSDLYTVVAVEMTHLLGISEDEDFLWEDNFENNDPSIKDVGVADKQLPVGKLYRYDNGAGGVEVLMTSNNGCGASSTDRNFPLHVAEADPLHAISFGGTTYYGAEDVGNACFNFGERYHPSILSSRIFREIYGYSISSQASFPNFYTHLDANGVLTVRGGSPGQVDASGNPFYNNTTDSNDKILVKSQGNNVVVEVDLEKQVRGTGVDSSTVFKRSFPKSSLTSIQIFGFDGVYCDTNSDLIFAEYCDSNNDMVADEDGWDDITLDFTDSNWIPSGGITVDGGTGQNTLMVLGPLAQTDYLLTGRQIDVSPASGTIQYLGFTDLVVVADPNSSNHTMGISGSGNDPTPFRMQLSTGNGPDTVTINGTPDGLSQLDLSTLDGQDQITIEAKSASTLVDVDAGLGNDGVSISPVGQDLDAVPKSLTLLGGGGVDILLMKDSSSSANHNYRFSVEPSLVSRFSRDNSHTYFYDAFEQAILNAGSGNDHVAILNTLATTGLVVNTDGGDDTIDVDSNGSDANGTVNTILSHLVIDGGDGTQVGTDTLNLVDLSDGQSNVVTITKTEVGSAPGDVFFGPGGSLQYFGMSQLTLDLGRPADLVKVESTAVGTDTTVNAGQGADLIIVGGPPDESEEDPGPNPPRDDLTVDKIESLLTINGEENVDTLIVNDIADVTGDVATLTNMTLGLGASDTLFGAGGGMVYTSIAQLSMLWGSDDDATFVESTHQDTETTLFAGDGNDDVDVSNPAGTVNDIRNILSVHGQSGTDRLTHDDGTDPVANTVTVTDQTVGAGLSDDFFGGGHVKYSGLEQLDVLGGTNDDTFFVKSTAPGTETNLGGGDGIDLFTVQSPAGDVDLIRGPLSIDGGAGATNVAALLDQFDPTPDQVTITAFQVGTGVGDNFFGAGGSLTYVNLSQLNLLTGTNDDRLNLRSTNAGTRMLIGGGAGNDAFSIDSNGSGVAGGTVDLILSEVDLFGGPGVNTLTLDDSGDATGDQASIRPAQPATGTIGDGVGDDLFGAGGVVKYTDFGAVALSLSELGADTVNVAPAPTPGGTLIGVLDANSTTSPVDLLNLDLTGTTSPTIQVVDENTGILTSGAHASVVFRRMEMINEVSGSLYDLLVDMNFGVLPGNDGTGDVVQATRNQFNGNKTLNLRVNGAPLFAGFEGPINSMTLIGSTDDDTFSIHETIDGLPHIQGMAPNGHTNATFMGAGLTPLNVGIHYDGGPGPAVDQFDLQLSSPLNVGVFQDLIGAPNSGVVNVDGEFTMSYESQTPIQLQGAGGSLVIDATLVTNLTQLLHRNFDSGSGEVSGDGGFETTTYSGFDDFLLVPPRRAIVAVSDPGFSYVDANNDRFFAVANGDVALTDGEVEDGRFDTQILEGGYVTLIAGAGLVINGAPIIARNITYKATGDLVVNTDLTSNGEHRRRDGGGDIRLISRDGSVLLDDPHFTTLDDIRIQAALDIVSTDDLLEALGTKSIIDLQAGRDIVLMGTTLRAVREVQIAAGNSITIGNSAVNEGLIQATDSRHGEVKLTTSRGDIFANGATIESGRKVNLDARHGDIIARDAVFLAIGNENGKVGLKAGNIDISRSWLKGNKRVAINARDSIFAEGSVLLACQKKGNVEVKAHNNIDLKRATVRAFEKIRIQSKHGNVDLTEADLAVVTGSTKGDIEIEGNTIDITAASILAPDKTKLKGRVLGSRGRHKNER